MNNDSRRRPSRAVVPAATSIALLAAACGGGSSPLSAAGPPGVQEALAYAKCMRSHGAPSWPDPNSQGQFAKTAADSAKFRAPASAYQACGHLLPDHGQIPPAVQHQVTLLAAEVRRVHALARDTQLPRPGWQRIRVPPASRL